MKVFGDLQVRIFEYPSGLPRLVVPSLRYRSFFLIRFEGVGVSVCLWPWF